MSYFVFMQPEALRGGAGTMEGKCGQAACFSYCLPHHLHTACSLLPAPHWIYLV